MSYEIISLGIDNVLMYSLLMKLWNHYEENPEMQSNISYIYKNTDKYVDFFNKLADFEDIHRDLLISKSAEIFNVPRNYFPSERQFEIKASQVLENILNPLNTLKTIESKINEKKY